MTTNAERTGERLRSIRRQKGLSLHEVEAFSKKEFKASVLGAYERGERAISVPRLLRLAAVYGVPSEQLLPRDAEVDLTEGAGIGPSSVFEDGFCLDLLKLKGSTDPEAQVVARYASMIQVQRQDFNGRVLTVRTEDLRTLACALDTPWNAFWNKLETFGAEGTSTSELEGSEIPAAHLSA